MERAIRHPDGTMITDSEWSAIKASARRIANELAGFPVSARHAKMRRTKLYYRTHYAREWTNAITRLEAEQPLLILCSSNWKADQTLGNSIQAILSKESNVNGKRSKNKQKGKGKAKMVNNGGSDQSVDVSGCKFFFRNFQLAF